MAVRDTSIQAYNDLVESGKGSTQRAEVLKLIVSGRQYDYTRQELSHLLAMPINAVCGRVNELVKANMIIEDHKKICPHTRNEVWALRSRT